MYNDKYDDPNYTNILEGEKDSRKFKILDLKNMENKYYTPDISEFHVGFEYEYYNIYDEISGDNEEIILDDPYWSKEIIKDPFDINWIENKILNSKNNRNVRVKYLDKEDIEDLGFEVKENSYQEMSSDTQYTAYLKKQDGTTCYIEFISYYTLNENPDVLDGRVTIWKNNTTRYDFRKRWVNEPKHNIVFVGCIRNKLELKKILKQTMVI